MSARVRGASPLSWWELLSVVVRHGGEATLTQLEDESGWSRPTVHRVKRQLVRARILTEHERIEHRFGQRRHLTVFVLGPELLTLRPLLERMDAALR